MTGYELIEYELAGYRCQVTMENIVPASVFFIGSSFELPTVTLPDKLFVGLVC